MLSRCSLRIYRRSARRCFCYGDVGKCTSAFAIAWTILQSVDLTSLAVIPSLSRGRATMQKTVIPSPSRGAFTEPDGCGGVIIVALHCGESGVNWPFAAIFRQARLGGQRWHADLMTPYHIQTTESRGAQENVPFSVFVVDAMQTLLCWVRSERVALTL